MSGTVKSPGEFVRNAMSEKGWTQTDLAYAIGTSTAAINQILSGKRGISGNMARALSVALDRSAEEFARIQAEWDVNQAEPPEASVESRSRILTRYPLRDMVKRGWVDPERSQDPLEQQLCRFFDVQSIDEVPHLTHSAKKTNYDEIPSAQLAWLFRAKQIASEMVTPSYDQQKMQDAVASMEELRRDPRGVRRVPKLLNDAGVRFVVVEGLPGGKIDGACFWLDDLSPVVALSLRFDRIDNFWFVLRHECSHVLHEHGKSFPMMDSDMDFGLNSAANDEEKIANEDASEFCVPSERITSFYLRKRPFFADVEVVAFSKKINVHPGLVVGQLQRMMGRYDFLRKHLVGVREHLSQAMMMDGWGDIVPVDR